MLFPVTLSPNGSGYVATFQSEAEAQAVIDQYLAKQAREDRVEKLIQKTI